MFDFSASLNDVVPLSLMVLSVDVKRYGEECFVDGCLLCVFLSLIVTLQIEFSECCV